MYSGVRLDDASSFIGAEVAAAGGGGGGGVGWWVWSSSRAAAEDERSRRGAPFPLAVRRTQPRHALNCRMDGLTDAIAINGGG